MKAFGGSVCFPVVVVGLVSYCVGKLFVECLCFVFVGVGYFGAKGYCGVLVLGRFLVVESVYRFP